MNNYIKVSLFFILIVFGAYFLYFRLYLGFSLSKDVAVWAQFGDYIGGILNPILTFVSLFLIIKSLNLQRLSNNDLSESLTLQREANNHLINEMENNRKTEKLRRFESYFFNMLDSQNNSFCDFSIESKASGTFKHFEAVNFILDSIGEFNKSSNKSKIKSFIENVDCYDKGYGLLRSFYLMINMIITQLSDENGFSIEERFFHFKTLIHFTDFNLLLFLSEYIKYMEYPQCKEIIDNVEFNEAMDQLGFSSFCKSTT